MQNSTISAHFRVGPIGSLRSPPPPLPPPRDPACWQLACSRLSRRAESPWASTPGCLPPRPPDRHHDCVRDLNIANLLGSQSDISSASLPLHTQPDVLALKGEEGKEDIDEGRVDQGGVVQSAELVERTLVDEMFKISILKRFPVSASLPDFQRLSGNISTSSVAQKKEN